MLIIRPRILTDQGQEWPVIPKMTCQFSDYKLNCIVCAANHSCKQLMKLMIFTQCCSHTNCAWVWCVYCLSTHVLQFWVYLVPLQVLIFESWHFLTAGCWRESHLPSVVLGVFVFGNSLTYNLLDEFQITMTLMCIYDPTQVHKICLWNHAKGCNNEI